MTERMTHQKVALTRASSSLLDLGSGTSPEVLQVQIAKRRNEILEEVSYLRLVHVYRVSFLARPFNVSVIIVVLLVFEVRSEATEIHIEELAIVMRGIVPTILVGRIVAGRARPDDSWSNSTTMSSIQFRSSTSSQSDSVDTSAGSESDLSPRVTLDLENGLEDSAES
ncbi:hypothetical protein ARMSODRAFT_980715 [Armillaria solidipes]|uniref:Uncharacterized protein n=1 Tax=Armillaria solidipes TaxID=1076256 RepID=A0A2H3AUT3_9AGAR|nr:hypothetical protein ARMSODRAFT_980715 [Armillaria solidipes]